MTKQRFSETYQEKFRAWAEGKPKIQENHAITLLQAADNLDQITASLLAKNDEIDRLKTQLLRLSSENLGLEQAVETANSERDAARKALASHRRGADEPSDGPYRAFLEMPEGYGGPVKISNPGAPVAEVTVYKDAKKSDKL